MLEIKSPELQALYKGLQPVAITKLQDFGFTDEYAAFAIDAAKGLIDDPEQMEQLTQGSPPVVKVALTTRLKVLAGIGATTNGSQAESSGKNGGRVDLDDDVSPTSNRGLLNALKRKYLTPEIVVKLPQLETVCVIDESGELLVEESLTYMSRLAMGASRQRRWEMSGERKLKIVGAYEVLPPMDANPLNTIEPLWEGKAGNIDWNQVTLEDKMMVVWGMARYSHHFSTVNEYDIPNKILANDGWAKTLREAFEDAPDSEKVAAKADARWRPGKPKELGKSFNVNIGMQDYNAKKILRMTLLRYISKEEQLHILLANMEAVGVHGYRITIIGNMESDVQSLIEEVIRQGNVALNGLLREVSYMYPQFRIDL